MEEFRIHNKSKLKTKYKYGKIYKFSSFSIHSDSITIFQYHMKMRLLSNFNGFSFPPGVGFKVGDNLNRKEFTPMLRTALGNRYLRTGPLQTKCSLNPCYKRVLPSQALRGHTFPRRTAKPCLFCSVGHPRRTLRRKSPDWLVDDIRTLPQAVRFSEGLALRWEH